MKLNKEDMLLYIITDRTWLGNNSLASQVEQSIKAGATFVQIREKNITFDEYVKIAKEIKNITDKYKVPFVINDDVDVAIAVDADGVHIGQSDENLISARKKLGDDKIIGVSAQNVEQAVLAQKNGADYLGVGAVFTTSTKLDASAVSYETLKSICNSVDIPVVAIGGISDKNILELKGSGIDGVSVISAVFAKPDIAKATSELCKLSEEMVSI